jgi:DNA-binding CsgD family transcriptional regulator/pimeloyl-ACP methyl ester carboxylesterase
VNASLDIRRVITPDGVEIAYHALGEGPPLICLFPYHGNDLLLEWAVPIHRRGLIQLSRAFTVIRLDFRGAGQSQRGIQELSLELLSLDTLTVLKALGLRSAGILALGNATLVAAYLGGQYSSSVDRLVLYGAGDSEVYQRLAELRVNDWEIEAEMRAAALGGLRDPQNTEALATVFKNAVDSETIQRFEALAASTDVRMCYGRVRTPTLLVSAVNDRLASVQSAEALASLIPGAQFRAYPGTSPLAIWRNPSAMQSIIGFLEGKNPEDSPAHTRRQIVQHAPGGVAALTAREVEVLELVAEGLTNEQISRELYVSLNTVRHHLKNIFLKTHTSNRTEAASFAHRTNKST